MPPTCGPASAHDNGWPLRPSEAVALKLGHLIAASTVWQILHAAGIDPAPRRSGPTWKQFVHEDAALLRRFDLLIVIEHGTPPRSPPIPTARGRRKRHVTS